ncbi:serine hydrolase domain-containing protein [Hyphococcus sp.]|uniref:serine hydrolase domain-containing protein n=1 Tax=Hyphococcus sp. TaxID=2038636 RepID=UPI0035C7701C
MKKIAALTTIVAGLASSCAAQEAINYASIDAYLAETIAADRPGCGVGVIDEGGLSYERYRGLAEREHNIPLTEESVFEVASISKQFTAFAVNLLVEDGKISLEDPVSEYFPELPASADQMTVGQLLTHTSGVRDYLTLMLYQGYRLPDYFDVEDILALLGRQQNTDFTPGEKQEYSNSGYVLLAELVARVSGLSLREFAQQRMFGPLGMAHTVFYDDPMMIVPGRTYGYAPMENGDLGRDVSARGVVGDGGVFTTLGDLAKWDANFYDNKLGGGAALIERIETPATLADGEQTPIASGFFIRNYRGQRQVGHTGYYGGYKGLYSRYPDVHRSLIVLCNNEDYSPPRMARELLSIMLAGHLEPAKERPPRPAEGDDDARTFSSRAIAPGRYYSEELDTYWEISRENGDTRLRIPHGEPMALKASGENILAPEDQWYALHVPAGRGEAKRFDVVYEDYSGIPFVKTDDD